jgi:energy-converting hydrogenase Eha subunit H
MTSLLMTIGYLGGSLLMADAIGNIGTTGHQWGLEFMVASIMLFGGAMAHLAQKMGE